MLVPAVHKQCSTVSKGWWRLELEETKQNTSSQGQGTSGGSLVMEWIRDHKQNKRDADETEVDDQLYLNAKWVILFSF